MVRAAWRWGIALALILGWLPAMAYAAGSETLYLGTDGFPRASLAPNPQGGQLPNFDLARDIYPGLHLERSSLGSREGDATRFQQWELDMSGTRLVGYPTVVMWSAPAAFDDGSRGIYEVFLLDCSRQGVPCDELGSAPVTVERGRGRTWVESTVTLPPVDHVFGEGRLLAVRVVVSPDSESDMMFAFGYPKHRSRLVLSSTVSATTVSEVSAATSPPGLSDELTLDKRVRAQPTNTVDGTTSTVPDGGVSPLLVSLAGSLALTGLAVGLLARLPRAKHRRRRFLPRRGISLSPH